MDSTLNTAITCIMLSASALGFMLAVVYMIPILVFAFGTALGITALAITINR